MNKLGSKHPELVDSKRLKVMNDDIINYKDDKHSFVMFFEVLDNMPHDKVLLNPQSGKYDQEVIVDLETNEETSRPISDTYIQ